MPATETGMRLTEQHHRRQTALRASTLRDFAALWPIWDPSDPASFDTLTDATATLVASRHRDSSETAAAYVQAFRTAEGVTSDVDPRLAPAVERERVAASLRATGRGGLRTALNAGQQPAQAQRTALVRASGAVARHTLDGGRTTIMGTVQSDPEARGYMRTTGANPCAFCAMLASRGPVFKAESFDSSDARFAGGVGAGGPGDFKVHDHCNCGVAPVYRRDADFPGRSEEFQDLWQRTAGQVPHGPFDRGTVQRRVFRRAYEGRGG